MPVVFSDAVEAAIREVCPPRDAFDAKDFNPIEYLSTCFPDEASLALLPTFLSETSDRLRQTESELLRVVEAQALGGHDADEELTSAKQTVAELYNRVSDIKARASESEETVKELCQYIRELDIAKTNLTTGINSLRSVQLWMLQLQTLASSFERKKYAHCRDALQEAKRYAASFSSLSDLPKIKELNDKQAVLCRQMEFDIRNNIFADVRVAAEKEGGTEGQTNSSHADSASSSEAVMAEACVIIDLMGIESVKKIRDTFIDQALATYALRFRRGTDDARLERTERRYVYLRSILAHYDSLFQHVFPRHWCVPQELCVTFCLRTKQELDWELNEAGSRGDMDVVVLMYVLQKTIDVERELSQRLAWTEDFPGRHELPVYRFHGLILSAFKEHMDVFVRNEDKLMSEALAQPLIPHSSNVNTINMGGNTNSSNSNNMRDDASSDAVAHLACMGWNDGDEDAVRLGAVLPLAEDMFVFIKESLKRTLRIAQHDVLLDMVAVWRRHLMRFAELVAALLPTLALTSQELRRACIIVNTAELCQSTSQDLTEEVCARSEAPARTLGLDGVLETFATLYSRAVGSVVNGLGRRLAPLLHEYSNGGFLSVEVQQLQNSHQGYNASPPATSGSSPRATSYRGGSKSVNAEVPSSNRNNPSPASGGGEASAVGSMGDAGEMMAQDESRLIRAMTHILHEYMLTCGALLPPNILRFLLDKMAVSIIPRYTHTLYQQRCLSTHGVAAMRVDAGALERVFLQLPNYNDPERLPSSTLTTYVRLVRKEFEPMHRALKVLQIDSRTETFVEVYLELTPAEERSIQDFVRLVELQGRHREDVRPWIASLSRRGVVEANRRDVALATATTQTESASHVDHVSGGGGGAVSGVMNLFGAVTSTSASSPGLSDHHDSSNIITNRSPTGGTVFSLSSLVAQLSSNSNTHRPIAEATGVHAAQREGGMLRNQGGGAGGSNRSATDHRNNCTHSAGMHKSNAGGGEGHRDGASGSHQDKEETLGSRFASAARTTATSINIFKF